MSNRYVDHALGLQERRVEAARRYAARAGLEAPPPPLRPKTAAVTNSHGPSHCARGSPEGGLGALGVLPIVDGRPLCPC
eukprot:11251638-Alexandrium_andersonii.AAC.1